MNDRIPPNDDNKMTNASIPHALRSIASQETAASVGEVREAPTTPRTLKGFRDLLPAQAESKGEMLFQLESIFRSFGFSKIETPHLEYAEGLLGQAGTEINKQVYRFRDHGDRDVCLRFDLTVPFARYAVQHRNELGLPFKRYAIGNVFRGESPQAGRYREFTQCDFDMVGAKTFGSSRAADAEIVQVMIASLEKLGLSEFKVHLNNRKIFNGLCEHLGISDRAVQVLRAVDKIGKIGRDGVCAELDELGLSRSNSAVLLDFVSLSEGKNNSEVLAALAPYTDFGGIIKEGINEMVGIIGILDSIPTLARRYQVDLAIARGLGYYTGVVFETFVTGHENLGSVCSGGRYANLASTFSKDPMPGVGASVGIDRLIAVMSQTSTTPRPSTPATVLVTIANDYQIGAAHSLASELRQEGFNVECYPQVDKLGVQFSYATRRGHQFVLKLDDQNSWVITDMSNNQRRAIGSIKEIREVIS